MDGDDLVMFNWKIKKVILISMNTQIFNVFQHLYQDLNTKPLRGNTYVLQ